MADVTYAVVIEEPEPGCFCAYAPDVPGCIVFGDSEEEVRSGLREALFHHLKHLHDRGFVVPVPTSRLTTVEVEDPEVA